MNRHSEYLDLDQSNYTEKEFDDIPDIIDPKFAEQLMTIIKKEFGNLSWCVKLYIADDGTGSIKIDSNNSEYGRGYSDKEILDAYNGDKSDKEILDEDLFWKKTVIWDWKKKYPVSSITYKIKSTESDHQYPVEAKFLFDYDMSDWQNTMLFESFKETPTTAKDDNGDVTYNWQSPISNSTTMENVSESDKEPSALDTDEISVVFSEAYSIWMNKIRERFNIAGKNQEVPRPFDVKGKSETELIEMIHHLDTRLVKLNEHRATDAGNIKNYRSDFSEMVESYRYLDKYLAPQSTHSNDEFEENWCEFKSRMDRLIHLIRNHSSQIV